MRHGGGATPTARDSNAADEPRETHEKHTKDSRAQRSTAIVTVWVRGLQWDLLLNEGLGAA